MAGLVNIAVYSDALVVLGTAGVVVPLVRRWGLSPVLGYLFAGMLLGPLGLGSFIGTFPALYWLTVVDAANVAGIADLGVVFLLFLIGLELSYERLLAMRRLVFGLGGLQVAVSSLLLAAALIHLGQTATVAVVVGSCLALSSTAIVLEVLSAQSRMATRAGRTSFAILLAQDLAVIPILMFVAILGAGAGTSVLSTVALALVKAVVAVGLIVVIGRALLRPLFRLVVATRSTELFIAAILFVIVATGVVAAVADLSMALGAFVAGLLLAETEYRKAIEATIDPFKGLLLGIFFFTVGMGIDARELLRQPLLLLACVAGLVTLKSIIILLLSRAFHITWPAAIETALLLAPGGEFAFVAIGLATTLGVVAKDTASFALAVTSLSMALIPVLSIAGQRLAKRLEPPRTTDEVLTLSPAPQRRHAIVVGYGRVGQVLCTMLERHNVPFTTIDEDPATIARARSQGKTVYYGDATSASFLHACGIAEASAVIVTIHNLETINKVVGEVRALRSDIPIIARARDAAHARHLYAIGVSDAVPETIEASLQLSEAALVGLGVPTGFVIASIHDMRDAFRSELQAAAKDSGRESTRSIRAKSQGTT